MASDDKTVDHKREGSGYLSVPLDILLMLVVSNHSSIRDCSHLPAQYLPGFTSGTGSGRHP